jgi:putative membrane protein
VLHALEHLAFLSTALAVWAVVIPAPRKHPRYGVAAGLLFATALQSGALGAILTFATAVLYPIHALGAGLWGLTALQDQQLAGVIMWIPAGAIYFIAIGVLAARWLKEASPSDVQDPVLVGTDEG